LSVYVKQEASGATKIKNFAFQAKKIFGTFASMSTLCAGGDQDRGKNDRFPNILLDGSSQLKI
jgi:hypothetical protein